MVQSWHSKIEEITKQHAKDPAHNLKKEPRLCGYKNARGPKPHDRTPIFWVVHVLVLLSVLPLLFGCGSKDEKEAINAISAKLEMIEDRLVQVEKATQALPVLESKLSALQESVTKLDQLVAATSEAQPPAEKQSLSKTKARYHVVRQGDTLYQIAQEYGISVQELIKLNNLSKSQTIYPGQKLTLTPGSRQ